MKWIVEAESIDDVVLGNYAICDTPLIECKDCKHYKTHISCIGDEYSGGDYWINDGNESPCEPTDFCSYAERREE